VGSNLTTSADTELSFISEDYYGAGSRVFIKGDTAATTSWIYAGASSSFLLRTSVPRILSIELRDLTLLAPQVGAGVIFIIPPIKLTLESVTVAANNPSTAALSVGNFSTTITLVPSDLTLSNSNFSLLGGGVLVSLSGVTPALVQNCNFSSDGRGTAFVLRSAVRSLTITNSIFSVFKTGIAFVGATTSVRVTGATFSRCAAALVGSTLSEDPALGISNTIRITDSNFVDCGTGASLSAVKDVLFSNSNFTRCSTHAVAMSSGEHPALLGMLPQNFREVAFYRCSFVHCGNSSLDRRLYPQVLLTGAPGVLFVAFSYCTFVHSPSQNNS
jgi:hypothetical protein